MRQGDPLENLAKGVVVPMARSFALVGLICIAGMIVTLRMKDGSWFFYIMLGSMPLLWLYERSQKAKRQEERRANREFWGLDSE